MQVKCHECGVLLEKTSAIKGEDGKYYHEECSHIKQERTHLHSEICRILKLKAPGPRIYSQIKTFIEKNGYTNKGIENALVYFFDIKKNSIEKSNNGIGIVPYIYDEANEYFDKLERKKAMVAKSAASYKKIVKTVTLKQEEEKEKDLFNLDDI